MPRSAPRRAGAVPKAPISDQTLEMAQIKVEAAKKKHPRPAVSAKPADGVEPE